MSTVSSLSKGTYLAHSGNYEVGRRGYKICKITPHIMAGKLTGKQCAVNVFQRAGRKASANYCIGYDGSIACSVPEENRAYTSSNWLNDCQAITIEISNTSNSSQGGQWPISDASWNSLVNLCVDICRRYNFRLNYDGTKNGSLTRHNMFASTDCPGKYLQSRLSELANTVNAKLDGNTATSSDSAFTTFVKEVQRICGAKVDGIPGPETLSKTITISTSKNRRHAAVKVLQAYLKSLGYDLGRYGVDGCFGNDMKNVIKQFQKNNGLSCVDGVIPAKMYTWKKLLKMS